MYYVIIHITASSYILGKWKNNVTILASSMCEKYYRNDIFHNIFSAETLSCEHRKIVLLTMTAFSGEFFPRMQHAKAPRHIKNMNPTPPTGAKKNKHKTIIQSKSVATDMREDRQNRNTVNYTVVQVLRYSSQDRPSIHIQKQIWRNSVACLFATIQFTCSKNRRGGK